MAGETSINIVGNLTGDPEVRFTTAGVPVCSFTVACKESRLGDSGQWEDYGEPAFWQCSVWREPFAGNVAETLRKGSRVMVAGKVRARVWTDKHEQNRRDLEVDVQAVGPDLRFARAQIIKPAREGQVDPGRPRPANASRPPAEADPLAEPAF